MNLSEMTIAGAGRMLRGGETTSVALTEAAIARMEATEARLNAFITPTPDDALASARQADADLAAGNDHGPLHGIPIAIKDLCATRGIRTTAGSAVLGDWVPDFDATVVRKLHEGGAVSLGKLNLHEFAFGTTSMNEHYGAVHNPWDLSRHPGGSSGGSGAAVAAGVVFGAIGTDTGGSIRMPAALCGTAGLMPTYGVVSRKGVTALSWSLDHIGPLTRTAEDSALFLKTIAGYDAGDPGSLHTPEGWDPTSEIGMPLSGLRIGVARSQFERVQPEVAARVNDALDVIRKLGASVTDVQIPMLDEGFQLPIISAEAASYHARWLQESPEKYSDSVRRAILNGFGVSAVEYLDALAGLPRAVDVGRDALHAARRDPPPANARVGDHVQELDDVGITAHAREADQAAVEVGRDVVVTRAEHLRGLGGRASAVTIPADQPVERVELVDVDMPVLDEGHALEHRRILPDGLARPPRRAASTMIG